MCNKMYYNRNYLLKNKKEPYEQAENSQVWHQYFIYMC